jgi:hypothetical protein
LDVPTDVCVAQLRQNRHAQYLYAIENRLSGWSYSAFDQIKWYIPLNGNGNIPPCPDGGYYVPSDTAFGNPACSLHGRGHQINE